MRFDSSVPGCAGIIGIVAGLLVVCESITLVTGSYAQWPIVLLGITVGLMAVNAINR
jgi:hypothetical protein